VRCPVHRHHEMKEREERVPFASREATGHVHKQRRIVLRCPVNGCPRVALKETPFYCSPNWRRHVGMAKPQTEP
jgi:hypothetical protein